MSNAGTATATTDTATTTAAAATTTATTAAVTAPWFQSRNDAEFTGYLQNRGLDKKEAADAAYETYKSHREAEKLLGAPKDQLLRLPKDPVDPAWNQVYEKLGRPAKADEYDFKGVKFADGTELDDNFTSFLRNSAFKANMSKDKAQDFAKDFVSHLTKIEEAETAERSAKLQAEDAELKRNWGANFEPNKFIARQGAMKLGITPEAVEAMEKQIGKKAVMEGFLKAGLAFGEDKFVANRAPGMQGIMTREQATATLKERRNDTEWAKKFMLGDSQAVNEFNALTEMMAGRAA